MAQRGRPKKVTQLTIGGIEQPAPAKASEPAAIPPVAEGQAKPPQQAAPAPSPKKVLALKINDDDSIDLVTMRPETKERLEKALKKLPASLKPVSEGERKPSFSDNEIQMLIGGIGAIQSIVARSLGVPADLAESIWNFSEEEVTELKKPTSAVLEKYVGKSKFLEKYGEVIALAYVFGQMEIGKYMAFQAALEAKKQADKPAPPAAETKVQPIRTNGGISEEITPRDILLDQ